MKSRNILLVLLSLSMLAAGLSTYTGPGDRTVTTTSSCNVLLYECVWNPDKVRYNYHMIDGWACSNESAPWTPWPASGPTCSAFTLGSKYWAKVPGTPESTTYSPASIAASATCDSPGNAGWCLGGAGVTFTVKEPIPGETISRVEGSVNSGALKTFCNVNAASGSCAWNPAEGSSALSAWAVSTWGDTSLKASLVTRVDPVAPAISVPLSPDGANGWYRSAPTITLTASDATSGLSSALFDTGTNSFTPPGDGSYTLTATALDVAGNSTSTNVTVKVDGTDPNLSVAAGTPDGSNGWYKSKPTLTLTASDATSGLDYAKFDLSGNDKFTPSADGVFALAATAQDLAGNSATKSTTIKVDSTDPNLSLPTAPDGANGWYITSPTLTLSASDATSGLASSGLDTGGNSVTISADGVKTISASAEDNAGNTASLSVTVKKDSLSPALAIPSTPDGSNGWYKTNPTITLSASDATSGLDFAKFDLSGNDKFTPSTDGVYALSASAQDMAGNTASSSASIKVDSTAPTVTGSFVSTLTNGWLNAVTGIAGTVTYVVTVADTTSGIASVQLTSNPGNATVQVLNGGLQYNLTFPNEGVFPTVVTVTDNAGNTSTLDFIVKRDITRPNSTYTPYPNSKGWYTSLPTLKIAGTDATSGVGSSYFEALPAGTAVLGSTYTPPGDGIYSALGMTTFDVAGNENWAVTSSIKVDTVPPTLSILPAANGSNGWHRTSPVTFSLSGTDATSGFWYAQFSTSFTQYTVSSEGITTLRATAYDKATNSTSLTYLAKLDSVAPALTIPLAPNGSNGWYKTRPTITLTASDTTSGLGSALFDTGSNSFTPPDDGSYTLTATALDVAGNSTTKSGTLKVDATAPNLSVPVSPDGENGWYVSTPAFTLAASDATSGINVAQFSNGTNQYTPPGDGLFTISASASDMAGNTATFISPLKVDTTFPVISIPTDPDGENGWYITTPTITLAASDATSGLVSAAFSDGSSSLTLADGSYTLDATAKDRAGNTILISAPVRVDTVPPELSISVNSQPVLNGWYNAPVESVASASDIGAGIDQVEYQVDGGDWTTASASTLATDGEHQVTYRATDGAGHHVLASLALKVDTTSPVTEVNDLSSSLSGVVTISGRSVDALSGLASVAYSLDGGITWKSLDGGNWSFSWDTGTVSDGLHKILIKTSDNVGNTATETISAMVANQAPKVSIQDSWDYADAGTISVARRNDISISRVFVTVTCAPAHPNAVYPLQPGELSSTFHWDMHCGDGSYASQATEYPVTLTACDIYGHCSTAQGKIIAIFRMTPTPTLSPTATATASPSATATRTTSPTPTAQVVITPTPTPEPPQAPQEKPFPWWLLLLMPGLLLVFGLNAVSDPRPAAILHLKASLFKPDDGQ